MKKFFFILWLLAISSLHISAQASVNVQLVGANYADHTVTFSVSWEGGSRGTHNGKIHNSKVWLWVDYINVNAYHTTTGNIWERATVSSASVISGTGNVSYDVTPRVGFWLQGADSGSYSATVTVALNGMTGQYHWCAYASDFPPNAFVSGGSYTLHGSPPFVVNGDPLAAGVTQYVGSITSLTDATGAPGIFCTPVGQVPGKYGCCSGLSVDASSGLCATPTICDPSSTVSLGVISFTQGSEITVTGSSYTQVWSRPVTATGCQKEIFYGGTIGSVKSDCRTNPDYAGDYISWCAAVKYAEQLCPFPWRIPTPDDVCRLHNALTGATCVEATNAAWAAIYINQWAVQWSGACGVDGTLNDRGSAAVHIVMGTRTNTHNRFNLYTTGAINLGDAATSLAGRTLRCVRD
ncbi:MAG: hypothetical protein LBF81_02045 [Prevotellaceae bacterium]|jgi:hypothetical protein|nr:hypothetical protein [Prevotellaceae bacterium]